MFWEKIKVATLLSYLTFGFFGGQLIMKFFEYRSGFANFSAIPNLFNWVILFTLICLLPKIGAQDFLEVFLHGIAGFLLNLLLLLIDLRLIVFYGFLSLIYWLLNLIYIALKKSSGPNGAMTFRILAMLLITPFLLYYLNAGLHSDNLYHLLSERPTQRLYEYNNDIIYMTSETPGIFKMTPSGQNVKIINTNTTLSKTAEGYNFYLDKDAIHFKADNQWYNYNLDTYNISKESQPSNLNLLIKDSPGTALEATDNKYLQNTVIQEYQVIGDGYLYFSNGYGVYRIKTIDQEPTCLVSGPITTFNIKNRELYYYDSKKGLKSFNLSLFSPPQRKDIVISS